MPETLDHPVLTDAQAAVLGALLSRPDTTAAELAEIAGTGGSTTAKALVLLEAMGLALRLLHQPRDGKRVAATWRPTGVPVPAEAVDDGQAEAKETTVEEKAEPGVAAGGAAKTERLMSGGLRALVIEKLASRPDLEFTPTSLSHLLGGRSAGAIANCLSALTEQGVAERTSDKPRRYRYLVSARDTT